MEYRLAAAVVAGAELKRLYLWVLENNTGAQSFYRARGGEHVGSKAFQPPGGGTITGLRYAWPDPHRPAQHPPRPTRGR